MKTKKIKPIKLRKAQFVLYATDEEAKEIRRAYHRHIDEVGAYKANGYFKSQNDYLMDLLLVCCRPAIILLCLMFLTGCMNQAKIDKQLARCPAHVRENVGEIKYMPISWGTLLMISGVTNKKTGEVWLTLWADNHTLLHEVGHSVYFRTPHDDFGREFAKAKGFVSIWSYNQTEAIAEAFVAGMAGRHNEKIDLAMRFYGGL